MKSILILSTIDGYVKGGVMAKFPYSKMALGKCTNPDCGITVWEYLSQKWVCTVCRRFCDWVDITQYMEEL